MEVLENITNGSNSTVSSATPGQSVVALMIFAALYCGILVLCALLFAITWCWCWCLCSHLKDMKVDMSKDTRIDTQEGVREEMRDDNMREEVREDNTKKDVKGDLREDNLINGLYAFLKKAMKVLESHVLRFIEFLRTLVKTSTVIGVIVAVTAAVLLVVGCVLVTQNGGSTGLNAEGIAGRVLLILTEVIFLIVWLSLVAGCAYLCCRDYDGNCICGCCTAIGCMFATMPLTGVVLLGWSSFEFHGTNSTVTPGLLTAGVVISSVGLVLPLCMVCTVCTTACLVYVAGTRCWLCIKESITNAIQWIAGKMGGQTTKGYDHQNPQSTEKSMLL